MPIHTCAQTIQFCELIDTLWNVNTVNGERYASYTEN